MEAHRWQLIQNIFETAIELPPQEREAYLEDTCKGDTALLKEISGMLEADASGNSLLDNLVRDNIDSLTGMDPTGKRFGPYQVIEEIGSGGMGAVYLAKRVDGQFEQQVALKLIKPGMNSGDIIERFGQERQILAQLQHPNIAGLLDGGMSADGMPFFSMEYVSGLPIDAYCDRHNLSIENRIKLFITVCEAVQFAHTNLIIHRDLKPGNIFITDDGTVKLLDFGIAKVFSEDHQDIPGITRTGMYAMTPEYSSPEQIRHQRVTTATDVYALGLILYELLTGCRPYEFSSSSLLDMEKVITSSQPERPSSAIKKLKSKEKAQGKTNIPKVIGQFRQISPERLQRKLNGDLDNICLLALNKEPERRYSSVELFRQDLYRYLKGLPVRARKESLSYRLQKFTRRHRFGVVTSILVSIILITLVIFYTLKLSDERDRALAEAQKAQAVSSFLVDLFKVADPYESKGENITAREILERGAKRIESELETHPETHATMLEVIGKVYYNLGLYEDAGPLLERSLELRQSLLGSVHPDVARNLSLLGNLKVSEGDYESAISLLNRALEINEKTLISNDTHLASSYVSLAWAWNLLGDYSRADTLYLKAMQIQRLNNDPDLGVTLNDLALLRHEMNRYDEAETYFKESLEILKRAYGEPHPEIATTLYNYAQLLRDMDNIDEAVIMHRKVLEMDRQLYGAEHPDVAYSLNGLASLLVRTGELDEAIDLYRQALAMRRKLLGDQHPNVGYNLNNLGRALIEKGKYLQAKQHFFEALEIHRNANGVKHQAVARTLKNIGAVYYHLQDYHLSKNYLEQAVTMCQQLLGDRHFTTANTMVFTSITLRALQEYDQAFFYAHTALQTARSLLGDSHSFTKRCLSNLSDIQKASGNSQVADSLLILAEQS